MRALPGNSATATATELLSDRSYPIKATDQLVFRGGQLDRVDMNVPLECGCPPPRQNVDRAANEVPVEGATASETRPAASADSMPATSAPPAESARSGFPSGSAAVADPRPAGEMHVQVSAPLVFHASGPPPAPVEDVRAAPVETQPVARASAVPSTRAVKAPATGPGLTLELDTPRRGFFRRIGGWFAKVFHSGS